MKSEYPMITKILPNVTIQGNGIIRDDIGRTIGRLLPDVKFDDLLEYRVSEAVETLKQAMKDHPDYAHSWHCQLAMAILDESEDPYGDQMSKAHCAASVFMKRCFDVETSVKKLETLVNDGTTEVECDTELDKPLYHVPKSIKIDENIDLDTHQQELE